MSAERAGPLLPLQTVLLVAAIFASGVLTGVALDRLAFAPAGDRRGLTFKPTGENGVPIVFGRLDLTADQEARIRAIGARWQPRADSLMEALFPRVKEINRGMFQEMACVLTPAQDSAYLAWRKREGLNVAEGEEQLALVREGKCPVPGAD